METMTQVVLLSAVLVSGSLMAQLPSAPHQAGQPLQDKPLSPKPFTGSLQAGAGYLTGNSTHSIGGHAWLPEEGSINLPDKISELVFPLDVACGSVAGNLLWNGRFELHGRVTENLTDPSTKMNDSDWGVISDSGTLDIYSESDAELTALSADVGGRIWFYPTPPNSRFVLSMGFGPSLLYQHWDWTISNVDQRYPSRPDWVHETQSGVVATYSADIVMPYLSACAVVKYQRLTGRAELGIGPAVVQDQDDHILRQKRSTADMAGAGATASIELRYELTKHLFTLARLDTLSIQASGTSVDQGYGGDLTGYYAEIDEQFTLISLSGGLAIGYSF